MKKLITLLFAAALVTAASAQSDGRYRNDNCNNNSYQSSPRSYYDQNGSYDQYSYGDGYNRNSQWDDQARYQYYRDRRRAERMRYEMMMRRNQARYYDQRRYDRYPSYGYSNRPTFQLSIGIGGRRY